MTSSVLVVVFALACQLSQLSQLSDPYADAVNQPAAASTNNSSALERNSDVVPLTETPAVQAAPSQNVNQPSGRFADPYGANTAPFGSDNSRPMLPDVTGTSRAAAPPPGYGSQPARSNSATASALTSTVMPGPKPSVLMRAMLTRPAGSRLLGQPVTLDEVIGGGQTRTEQALRVEAYWDLCSSVADYYLGLREQQELQQLRALVPQAGASLQQAGNELGVRVGTSQRAALASQYRLASLMGRGPDTLPLPGDLPHCGNYQSHYEQMFAGRPSLEAQELSAVLPLRYAELKDAAAAVTRAEDFMQAVVNNRNANSDGTGALRALELLALRRRAFVQIARDYNRRIARYVELAMPGEIGADRLIGRLIMRADSSTAIRATGAVTPNRQSRNGVAPPRTFAEDWTPATGSEVVSGSRDDAVTPVSGESSEGRHEERSLLVKPR